MLDLFLLVCGDIETCPGPEYMIEELRNVQKKAERTCRKKGLSFVRLKSNVESLCAFIGCHQNIDNNITLSEIHTSADENTNLYTISGYDLILQPRKEG